MGSWFDTLQVGWTWRAGIICCWLCPVDGCAQTVDDSVCRWGEQTKKRAAGPRGLLLPLERERVFCTELNRLQPTAKSACVPHNVDQTSAIPFEDDPVAGRILMGSPSSCSSGGQLWLTSITAGCLIAYPLCISTDRPQRIQREAPRGVRNPPTLLKEVWQQPLLQRPADPCCRCQQRVAHAPPVLHDLFSKKC